MLDRSSNLAQGARRSPKSEVRKKAEIRTPKPGRTVIMRSRRRANRATITHVGQTSGLPVEASSGCLSVPAGEARGFATGRPEVCPTSCALPFSPC